MAAQVDTAAIALKTAILPRYNEDCSQLRGQRILTKKRQVTNTTKTTVCCCFSFISVLPCFVEYVFLVLQQSFYFPMKDAEDEATTMKGTRELARCLQ